MSLQAWHTTTFAIQVNTLGVEAIATPLLCSSGVRSKSVGDIQKISPRLRVPASPCQSQPTTY